MSLGIRIDSGENQSDHVDPDHAAAMEGTFLSQLGSIVERGLATPEEAEKAFNVNRGRVAVASDVEVI